MINLESMFYAQALFMEMENKMKSSTNFSDEHG